MSLDKPKSKKLDASDYTFAIVASRFNQKLVDAMLKDVRNTLMARGAKKSDIKVLRVPGSAELPFAASRLALLGYDVIICLGVVIAGETPHHMIIAHSTAGELQRIAVENGIPIINGIVVTNDKAQAEARTIGKIRRGIEFAESAIEMAIKSAALYDEIEEFNSDDDWDDDDWDDDDDGDWDDGDGGDDWDGEGTFDADDEEDDDRNTITLN